MNLKMQIEKLARGMNRQKGKKDREGKSEAERKIS